MDFLRIDLRLALRRLLKSPAFAVVSIATLTLAIAANTAIFSLVRAVLWTDLPFTDPEDLYLMQIELPATAEFPPRTRYLEAQQSRAVPAEVPSVEDAAVYQRHRVSLVGEGTPQRLEAVEVSANFFSLLGASPQLGRPFSTQGWSTGKPEVVVSHDLWRTKLGRDNEVVGSRLVLDGLPHTVAGVMPADFAFPHHDVALWTSRVEAADDGVFRSSYPATLVRLSDDTSADRATREVGRLAEEAGALGDGRLRLIQVRESLVGEARTPLLLLAGAVCLVLLIAAANLVSLLMVRISRRSKDFAVRMALGGQRGHLLRQTLTEVSLVSLAGGGLGFLLATWVLRVLPRWLPGDLPRAEAIEIDGVALAVTLGASLAIGLACGLWAALRNTRRHAPGLVEVLRSATSEPATARGGRRLLLIAEVGLAVVVLVGAGLLVRSYAHLAAIDPGLAPGPVLVAGLDLSSTYPLGTQRQAFFDSLLERLDRHPEVEDVGVIRYPPMTSGFSRTGVTVAGATSRNSQAIPQQADPGYFDAAGLRLLEGRWFEPAEHRSQAAVAVVNGAFVDEYLTAGSAIGREVTMSGRNLRVVGVIDDVRMLGPLFEPSPTVYTSYRLGDTPPSMTVVLRTTGSDPLELVPFLRSSVAELDPTLPLESVDTLQARLATATAQPRFYAVLLAVFGLLATLLAAAGVYALVAQSVVDQTRSLGIRRALGAQGADVSGWVLRQGLTPVVIGIAFGLAAAAAGARLLSSQLHEVSTHDAPTYLAAVTLFLAVGLLATLAPLRRALRVDPLEALREE